MNVHTVVNDAFGLFNVAVAVWMIRGGRRRYGPGWTAGWAGYAAGNVVGFWWHSLWPAALAVGAGAAAVIARRVHVARTDADRIKQEETRRFRLDHAYDRDRASGHTRSRYGNYLNQHRETFSEIAVDYDDPTVAFAAAVWRIAQGPVMSPPFVSSPRRVRHAWLERNDWNGEAVINAEIITGRPAALRDARTSAGSWYRDWPTGWDGEYEGVDGRELEHGSYLLTSAQILLQVPPGTLPRITDIPARADALLDRALECLNATVQVLNREIGPLLDQMETGR